MAYRPIKEMSESLEEMVDQMDIHGVLDMMSELCYEKAAHVASNWGDEGLAKAWRDSGVKLEKLRIRIERHW